MNTVRFLLIIALMAVFSAGCGSKTTRISENADQAAALKVQANTRQSATIATPEAMPVYAFDEVSVHIYPKDCWIAVHNKVYDISSFIPKYPDEKLLTKQCGKGASATIDELSAKTDEKIVKAMAIFPQFEIGILTQ